MGQRSLARLRLRINEKENEIFSFFNAQNSSSRMDIVCSKRRPTGTYIMKRECEPRFMKSLRAEMARGMLLGTGIGFSQRDLVEFSTRDFEMLQNEMTDLMASSQEFARSLADLADLAENYEAHRKAMFERQ